MPKDRIVIGVSSFTELEAEAGIQDLLSELKQREWLLEPEVFWNNARNQLIVQIDRDEEDQDSEGQATLDEVWDCVIATINFTNDLRFEILTLERH